LVASTGAAVVGVDLGGTKVLARVVDPARPLDALATARVDTPRGPDAIVAAIADLVARVGGLAGGPPPVAVGVGAAGLVGDGGVVRTAPNLPGVVGLELGARLEAVLGRPVVVENDATCAMVAEHRAGAAAGFDHACLVTLGTGIGGGLIIDGRLVRGAGGLAGEPGHVVVDPNGPPCPCGRRGCWERFASGSGLGRLAREAAEAGRADRVVALAGGDPEGVRGEHLTRAALEGDPDALEVMRTFAWWVALGLANLAALLDTEVLVIGGGLVAAGPLLLDPTREAFAKHLLGFSQRAPVSVVLAALGPEAGAIGAAFLAADLAVGRGA
jgi:glucokinase